MLIQDELLAKALVKNAVLKEKTINGLLQNAKSQKKTLQELLFEREVVPDQKLGQLIAQLYEIPFVSLSDKTIPDVMLRIVPYTLASHQNVIPFEQTPEEIKVAFNDPSNYELRNFLEKKTGLKVSPYYATKKDIRAALKFYNRDVNAKFKQLLKGALKDLTKIESLKDAAKILDTIILFAYQRNASDIHIEPHKNFISVRYRIDGVLQTIAELPIDILELLITRIKVLSGLRTDEHNAAQDGRFKIDLESNEITLRVSIIPTYDGEKGVLRVLSSTGQELNIEALGFSEGNLKIINNNILKTHGMILVTGPTGSGKTTTMYSILRLLNSPEVNISTIEDPIEYRLEGINQIQANPKTNLTFAKGLRSLLRQDPDILMVGEIRDEETGGIAVNASLTGHLVLATLHTNDVGSTLPRLIDMGIEPFLVAATVKMIMAQRLVRTICQRCKKPYPLTLVQLEALGEKFNIQTEMKQAISTLTPKSQIVTYKGEGCQACGGSGFKGRTAIAEVLEINNDIRKLIYAKQSPEVINEAAIKNGMVPMFADGLRKVIGGVTTIEEILRVMRS